MDPLDICIQIDKNHDWSKTAHAYNDRKNPSMLKEKLEDLKQNYEFQECVIEKNIEDLNKEQKMATQLAIDASLLNKGESSTDGVNYIGRLQLILGPGGTGKSEVIKTIKSKLVHKHGLDESHYSIMATTRKAATVINGCTIHSYKEGLGIPISNNYVKLSECTLESMRERFKTTKIIIIDEFSMIK